MKKKTKLFITLTLIVSIIFTGAVFATDKTKGHKSWNDKDNYDWYEDEESCDYEVYEYENDDFEDGDFESYTFEEELNYLHDIGLELNDEDTDELQIMFEEAINSNSENAWDNYYDAVDAKIVEVGIDEIDSEEEDFTSYTFEEELVYFKEMGVEFSKEEITDLKELFDTAMSLDTEEAWDDYYTATDFIYEDTDWEGQNGEETFDFDMELELLTELGVELTDEQANALGILFDNALEEDTDETWNAYEDALSAYLSDEQMEEYIDVNMMDENIELYAVYRINNGKLVLSIDVNDYPDGQAPQALTSEQKSLHQKLWLRVNKMIPAEYLSYFKTLEVGTDGVDGILASVVEMEDLSKWTLFLDIEDSMNNEGKFTESFDYTMIHELGHVVTLNSMQLNQDGGVEGTYETEEGVSKPNSYINKFYNAFWKNASEDSSAFVSDYAMSNIEEDMAESFADFVTKSKRTGNSIADQKVNFFYSYTELVKLRDDIRTNLDMNK